MCFSKNTQTALLKSCFEEIRNASDAYWNRWNVAPSTDKWNTDNPDDLDDSTAGDEYGCEDWCDHQKFAEYSIQSSNNCDAERAVVWASKIDIVRLGLDEEEEYTKSAEHVQVNCFRTRARLWRTNELGLDYCIRDCDGEGQHLFTIVRLPNRELQYTYLETYEGQPLEL